MELITVGIIIGLFVCISIVICLTFKLFIQKGHIFVLSILIAWFLEGILIRALDNTDISGTFLFTILFPCLCLSILYLMSRILCIQFRICEYIFACILYIPSEIILLIVALLIRRICGLSL